MSESRRSIDSALQSVWLRHRDAVVDELEELIRRIDILGSGTATPEIVADIGGRAHRLAGSLTMVGRPLDVDALRSIETRASIAEGAVVRDEEVVNRLHDLLVRLRSNC